MKKVKCGAAARCFQTNSLSSNNGGALKSKTQYSVCITVWDNKGNCSALKSKFETAFLNADEWKGCFSKSPFDRNESKVFVYGIENPPVYFEKILILRTKL